MAKLFYYRHIIGDYDRDTKDLSLLEHGAYRRLLDAYYANRGPLIADPDRLYRVTSAILPDEQAAVKKVAYLYFDLVKGMLVHEKCDEEIARVMKESEAQRARARKRWPAAKNGDAGGKSPAHAAAHAEDDTGGNAGGMPSRSRSDAEPPKKPKASPGKPERKEAEPAGKHPGAHAAASPRGIPVHSHSHIKDKEPPISPLPAKTAKPAKPKSKRFTPPTADQVRAYCEERGNTLDAETFCDFYESKGWMVGKNKMQDWRAAVRTWERTRTAPGGKRAQVERANESLAAKWAEG